MKTSRIFLAVFFVFAFSLFANAQSDTIYRVRTRDGNEYIGKLVSKDDRSLRLKTERLGEITLRLEDVKSMDEVDERLMVKGEYWDSNPQSTKYFVSPTGYGLKKGEGYYQNAWIFFNQVTFGITDYFSFGAGTIPLFLFGAETPVWISPKFSIPVVKDKVHLGVGSLFGVIVGSDLDNPTFGTIYGSATFGSRDKNVGVGIGWGFADGEFGDLPTMNFSFLSRVSKNWYLLSENYYFSGSESVGILSFGARWVPKIVGIDFGLILPVGEDVGVGFAPWLGVTIPFGKKKLPLARNKGTNVPIAPFAMAAFK